jgi:zinc protease
MALRIAVHELRKLVRSGLSERDFAATRDYLMKNVFVMTATQNQQIGYALDSQWYGIGDYPQFMRERLAKLTAKEVKRVIRKYLSGDNLQVVMVTKDAEALKQQLVADSPSAIRYDAPKPKEIVDEDKAIGALKLRIRPEAVTIEPVEEVFKK